MRGVCRHHLRLSSVSSDRRRHKGDHDGDRALAIWQRAIVESFRDADLAYSNPPESIKAWFDDDPLRMDEFLMDMEGSSESEMVLALQKVLLGAMRDTSLVGKYSMLHESAVYSLGLDHNRTMELGWWYVRFFGPCLTRALK